jgi:hypothetical protein
MTLRLGIKKNLAFGSTISSVLYGYLLHGYSCALSTEHDFRPRTKIVKIINTTTNGFPIHINIPKLLGQTTSFQNGITLDNIYVN